MNKITKLVSLGLLGAAVLTPSTDADADQIWMMNGQLCQPQDSTHAGRIVYENTQGVRNNNTSNAANVKCPAALNGTVTGSLNTFTLYVHDRHSTQNVSCTMRMYEETGTITYSQTVTTSGSADAIFTPSFTGFPTSDVHHITIACSLPPFQSGVGDGYSRILSYVASSPD